MRAVPRRMPSSLLLVLALVATLLAPGGGAVAHVALVASEPAADSAYESAPRQVRLRFSGEVTPVALRLRDANGRRIELTAPPRVDGATIEQALPADLPKAVYVLTWRVTAADSHPARGELVFAVATEIPLGFVPAPSGASDALWQAVNVALRLVVSAGVLIAAGAVLFAMLVAPLDPAQRRGMARIAAIGALAAVVAIPARGALLVDAEEIDLAVAWSTGAASSLGTSMTIAAIGLLAIAVAWLRASPPPLIAAIGAETALVSFALSGHVATAEPRWLTAAIVVLHVACAAFWLGALPALGRALRGDPMRAAAVVARFSRVALLGVGLLILVGGTMAVIQIADPEALGTTPYGRLLALKLVAVVALLAIASGNRLLHAPALARGDTRAARRLQRAIGWEKATFGAVLLSTATLSLTPPPRATLQNTTPPHIHMEEPEGIAATAASTRLSAVIELLPGRAGRNRALVDVLDADGRALVVRALIVELIAPRPGEAPLRLRPQPRGGGGYAIDDVELPIAGRWHVRLEIATSDSENASLTTEVDIR